MTEKVPGVNLEVSQKCSKGTKMSKTIKTLGALLPFKTHSDRKHYTRLVAKTQYEATLPAWRVKKESTSDSTREPALV